MQRDRYLGEIKPPDRPQIRIYTWDKPTISLGCNQNPARRIDSALCRQDAIPVVSRPTGGRELLHGHDLCYTVAIPLAEPMSAVNAKKVFARINDALVAGLRILGVMAEWGHFKTRAQVSSGPCFAQIDLGEITIGGRKLIASAQRIFERCLLQQGTMPLYEAPVDLVRYLILDRRNLTRNRIAELATHLGEHIGREFNMDSIVDGFRRAFEDAFGAPSGPVEDLHEWFQRNKRQYASV